MHNRAPVLDRRRRADASSEALASTVLAVKASQLDVAAAEVDSGGNSRVNPNAGGLTNPSVIVSGLSAAEEDAARSKFQRYSSASAADAVGTTAITTTTGAPSVVTIVEVTTIYEQIVVYTPRPGENDTDSSGNSNVLIQLQSPPPRQPPSTLSASQSPLFVVEIVVPLCIAFFCLGLLIAWRVVKSASVRARKRGTREDADDASDFDPDGEGGGTGRVWYRLGRWPTAATKNTQPILLGATTEWQTKKKSQVGSQTDASSNKRQLPTDPETISISSTSSDSSHGPQDAPPDADGILEHGLSYPAEKIGAPADPFAPSTTRHDNVPTATETASAPPAEKYATELLPSLDHSFLVSNSTSAEESLLYTSQTRPELLLWHHHNLFQQHSPLHHDSMHSQSSQEEERGQRRRIGDQEDVADALFLLNSLAAPPPSYTEALHHAPTPPSVPLLGILQAEEVPSAPPLEMMVDIGREGGSHQMAPFARHSEINDLERRRDAMERGEQAWSMDASSAWMV
ncbi:hypothetical protein BC830DRAFT_1112405 [Chytriomyces sp. MP71]|nr:hypothetical protein BC830DRAFT_1112405 [Chytriomyces sp. MP71]